MVVQLEVVEAMARGIYAEHARMAVTAAELTHGIVLDAVRTSVNPKVINTPLIAHIGLGNHTGPVDIAVRFPSGKTVMTRPCVIALSPRVNHEVGRQRCVPAPRAVRLFNGANKYTAIRTTIDVRAPRRQVPIGAL